MKEVEVILGRLIGDARAGPVHLCVYQAIWMCGESDGGDDPFVIRRAELMRLAKIRGMTTYFRVMRELAEWGYIEYWPSMAREGKSRVRIVTQLR
jgi:hypothetical protein